MLKLWPWCFKPWYNAMIVTRVTSHVSRHGCDGCITIICTKIMRFNIKAVHEGPPVHGVIHPLHYKWIHNVMGGCGLWWFLLVGDSCAKYVIHDAMYVTLEGNAHRTINVLWTGMCRWDVDKELNGVPQTQYAKNFQKRKETKQPAPTQIFLAIAFRQHAYKQKPPSSHNAKLPGEMRLLKWKTHWYAPQMTLLIEWMRKIWRCVETSYWYHHSLDNRTCIWYGNF